MRLPTWRLRGTGNNAEHYRSHSDSGEDRGVRDSMATTSGPLLRQVWPQSHEFFLPLSDRIAERIRYSALIATITPVTTFCQIMDHSPTTASAGYAKYIPI